MIKRKSKWCALDQTAARPQHFEAQWESISSRRFRDFIDKLQGASVYTIVYPCVYDFLVVPYPAETAENRKSFDYLGG